MVVLSQKISSALAKMEASVQSGNDEGQRCVAYVAFAVFLDDEPGVCSLSRVIAMENAPAEAMTIAMSKIVDELEAALSDEENMTKDAPEVDA